MADGFTTSTLDPELIKRQKMGLVQSLKYAYKLIVGRDLALKPEQGGPVTSFGGSRLASPSLDRTNREFYEPIERRALFSQLETLLADHPILRAGLVKFTHGAVAAGFKVKVVSGRSAEQVAEAQKIINRIKKRAKLEYILPAIAFQLFTFGDTFLQPIIDKYKEIIGIACMPVASIERRTDDTDQFIDENEAFWQKDVNGNKLIYKFKVGQLLHARHLHTPGHRYGMSQIFSARGTAKDSIDAIRTLLPRRLANMPFRWFNIKGYDDQPLSNTEFKQFKADTSRRIAIESGQDSVSAFEEVYTNNIELKVTGGDPNLGTLDDIEMLLDATMSVIGISRQLLGWGTTINRDIIDELRNELYAAQAQFAKSITEQILIPIFETGLKLKDINPDEIEISVEYAQALTESQMIAKIDNARKDFLAGGIDALTYALILQPYYGFEDAEKVVKKVQEEKALALAQSQAGFGVKQPENISMPGQNGNNGNENGNGKNINQVGNDIKNQIGVKPESNLSKQNTNYSNSLYKGAPSQKPTLKTNENGLATKQDKPGKQTYLMASMIADILSGKVSDNSDIISLDNEY